MRTLCSEDSSGKQLPHSLSAVILHNQAFAHKNGPTSCISHKANMLRREDAALASHQDASGCCFMPCCTLHDAPVVFQVNLHRMRHDNFRVLKLVITTHRLAAWLCPWQDASACACSRAVFP